MWLLDWSYILCPHRCVLGELLTASIETLCGSIFGFIVQFFTTLLLWASLVMLIHVYHVKLTLSMCNLSLAQTNFDRRSRVIVSFFIRSLQKVLFSMLLALV